MGAVLRNRPDYSRLLRSGDLGDAQLKLAMAQRWDDIAVRVFLQRDSSVDEPVGIDRNTFAGLGVSIPLPLRNKNQQAIEEAKIDIEKARRARAAKMFSIHSELRRALQARLAAYKLASSARADALPLAMKNLDDSKPRSRTARPVSSRCNRLNPNSSNWRMPRSNCRKTMTSSMPRCVSSPGLTRSRGRL